MRKFLINSFLVMFFSSVCIASSNSMATTTLRIKADPSKGFSYPYYLYVPPNLLDKKKTEKTHSLLIIPNNSGRGSDELLFHESKVKFKMFQISIVFNRLNTPVLMPVFSRPMTDWKIYTHALDRDSLITPKKTYARFDLQLVAMIKHARDKLKSLKIESESKVLMYGFSASGMFVNRFTFLHPEIVKAAVIGSPGGWAIAPLKKYKKETLNYPIGVSDLKKVSGKNFDLANLRTVPMFMFLGDKDENDSVVFRDGYSKEDEKIIFRLFGKTPVSRWALSKKLYDEANLDVTFNLYPDVAHKVTKEIRKDIMIFLSKHKA